MSHISFKFRLNPTTSQSEKLSQIAGSCRFVFNYFLAMQKRLCEKRKETRETTQAEKFFRGLLKQTTVLILFQPSNPVCMRKPV